MGIGEFGRGILQQTTPDDVLNAFKLASNEAEMQLRGHWPAIQETMPAGEPCELVLFWKVRPIVPAIVEGEHL